MSLDFYLCYDYCEHCKRGVSDVFTRNITHNLIPMWEKAGVFEALYESQGKRASEVTAALRAGEREMERNFDDFKQLNSPNGWGKVEDAVEFLHDVLVNCERNPTAFIVVSK